jgi:hypothetical protein
MGITPFQGYNMLRHHETQAYTLGYRIPHLIAVPMAAVLSAAGLLGSFG